MTRRAIHLLLLVFFIANSCSKEKRPLSPGGSNGQSVGRSSRELLSAEKYSSLVIEIQYMPGFAPTSATVSNLTAFVTQLVNKPLGIRVEQKEIGASGKSVLSLQDIKTIEQQNRTKFTEGTEIAAYFLFADAVYEQSNVLGIAYLNTSMCLFGRTIHDHSGDLLQPSREKLETTVIEHEFGHILGLVDIGAPMQSQHKDAPHGAHCNVQNCLMYYQVETTDYISNLTNSNVPALDAQCRADLRANGGR